MTEIGKISTKSQEFEWTIDDFFSYTKECARYSSPDFLIGDSKWCINIYPNGETQNDKEYISVFLQTYDNGAPITVDYRIGIKTSYNDINFEKTTCHTFGKETWGWKRFAKRSNLFQKKSELVPLNILTITCFVKVQSVVPSLESRRSKIVKDLNDLFISKDLVDVTVHVKDDSFEAHRIVLAARSPVFAAMFRNDTLEKKTGIVKISDADPEAFSVFLTFLYSGEIKFPECNVFELYKISHKYDVPDLKLLCVNFMINNLSVENFCETFMLSDKFEEKDLLTKIQSFFNKNFEKIVSSDSWITFLEKNVSLGNSLLISMAPKVKIMD